MSNVEDDIKAAALMAGNRPSAPSKLRGAAENDAHAQHRAIIRGAIIRAHTELGGPNIPWAPVDDRILDIIDQWLANRAGK